MKKVLFGIALILFAILLFLLNIEISRRLGRRDLPLLIGLIGLVIAGTGTFTKDP